MFVVKLTGGSWRLWLRGAACSRDGHLPQLLLRNLIPFLRLPWDELLFLLLDHPHPLA
jgi:hypothetical protein